jgi:hypothetical protein
MPANWLKAFSGIAALVVVHDERFVAHRERVHLADRQVPHVRRACYIAQRHHLCGAPVEQPRRFADG